MDAQTQLVAELYKTLNDAQKQEVCNMIDTLLSQQLNDQQSLDSHSAATENQDSIAWERLHVPADQSKTRSHHQPPQGGRYRYYTDLPPRKQGGNMSYSSEVAVQKEIPHSMMQDDIETLRKRILEMLDRLSDADCAEVYATLKERGVLWIELYGKKFAALL
jgi:ATP-dependent exoDNAse (exonuclease V) beta subunit